MKCDMILMCTVLTAGADTEPVLSGRQSMIRRHSASFYTAASRWWKTGGEQ